VGRTVVSYQFAPALRCLPAELNLGSFALSHDEPQSWPFVIYDSRRDGTAVLHLADSDDKRILLKLSRVPRPDGGFDGTLTVMHSEVGRYDGKVLIVDQSNKLIGELNYTGDCTPPLHVVPSTSIIRCGASKGQVKRVFVLASDSPFTNPLATCSSDRVQISSTAITSNSEKFEIAVDVTGQELFQTKVEFSACIRDQTFEVSVPLIVLPE
jgi:hypothetical protein